MSTSPKEMRIDGALEPSKLAIAYIRVSMAREEMVSPEQQEYACRTWAEANGITVIDVVYDLDESGRNFAKRKVSQIIERVRGDEAKYAIVWKYSRWGRNSEATSAHIRLLREAGGQIISATEQIDVSTSTGRFMERQILSMDELYSDMVGDSWRETIARRKRNQLPANGRPRFGYRRCPDCRRNPEDPTRYLKCKTCEGVLQPDEDVGPHLAACYEMYVEGWSFRACANYLRYKGIRSSDGNLISDVGLLKIMDTGFAAGLICELPEELRATNPRNRHIRNLTFLPGKHKALISNETWEAYKARRIGNYKAKPAEIYAAYALSGLPRCGQPLEGEDDGQLCMSIMLARRRTSNPEWVDFHCRMKGDLRACEGTRCRHDRALATVKDWVFAMATDSSTAEAAMKHAAARTKAQNTMATLKTQRERVATRRGRLVDGYTDGIISKEDYLDRKAEVDAEVEALDNQIAELGGAVDSKIPSPKEFQGLANVWDKLTTNELNMALKKIISYIIVHPTTEYFELPVYTIVPRWEAAPIKKLPTDHTRRTPKSR